MKPGGEGLIYQGSGVQNLTSIQATDFNILCTEPNKYIIVFYNAVEC